LKFFFEQRKDAKGHEIKIMESALTERVQRYSHDFFFVSFRVFSLFKKLPLSPETEKPLPGMPDSGLLGCIKLVCLFRYFEAELLQFGIVIDLDLLPLNDFAANDHP